MVFWYFESSVEIANQTGGFSLVHVGASGLGGTT